MYLHLTPAQEEVRSKVRALVADRIAPWAGEIDAGEGTFREVESLVSMGKCYASDVAMKVTLDAVQILGGAGYLKGAAVERLMRDAKAIQIFDGTNQIQRMIIARNLVLD
jgi:alkylation response protein AidB-like acyl-CoA dehydrogenase